MTAAVYRSTPALSLPPTQNTAPVLEFNCLYTHDIRRKQKRWQDGFLRFHTFNKRVMVYDTSRHFVGSAHWTADEELKSGDELTLDKEAVLVEVAESVGRTETDLTELRTSRKKQSSECGSSSPARKAQTPKPKRAVTGALERQPTQLKHRSLNALLGTPKGPIGKAALPTKSPYEQRRVGIENEVWEQGGPSKRHRAEIPVARSTDRKADAAKSVAPKDTPLWARTADSASQRRNAVSHKVQAAEVIDLRDDEFEAERFMPGFSSDMLAPPSSPDCGKAPKPPPARSSSPAFQTQRDPAKSKRVDSAAPKSATALNDQVERRAGRDVSMTAAHVTPNPPGSDASRTSERGRISTTTHLKEKPSAKRNHGVSTTDKPPIAKSGQTFRISASSSNKKTLLCQNQLYRKPDRTSSTNTEDAAERPLEATSDNEGKPKVNEQQQRLQQRLERIRKKDAQIAAKQVEEARYNVAAVPPDRCVTLADTNAPTRPQTSHEASAAELARLDQMLLPPNPPRAEIRPPKQPARTEAPPQPALPVLPEPRQDPVLRRVVSASQDTLVSKPRRALGVPMRVTPSPSKQAPQPAGQTAAPVQTTSNERPTVIPKPRPKKSLQRTVSLDVTSNGTATVMLSKPFQPPKPPEQRESAPQAAPNPWSREAFDLFTWRPPGWDEENWCIKELAEAVDTLITNDRPPT